MTDGPHSLGQRLAGGAAAERIASHQRSDRSKHTNYDETVGRIVAAALRGDRVLDVKPAKKRTENDRITLVGVDQAGRQSIDDMLLPDAQRARGAWYLPEGETLAVGIVHQAWWSVQEHRLALSAADAERAAVKLDTADAIVAWAVLAPVFELLWLPLKHRSGQWLGERRPELMAKDWPRIDALYQALGIDLAPLDIYRSPDGWADRADADVLAARDALLAAWAAAPDDVGQRVIAWHIDQLVDRYYAKAKNGLAERAKVLHKATERSLTAAFGGDWLDFLNYIGEAAHPSEKITTAVPETALLASGKDKAAQAAQATGLPVEEIERVLAAYWDGAEHTPVDERVAVIERWWTAFDDTHARQALGMPSLWGLLGDRMGETAPWLEQDGRYTPRGFAMVGEGLVADIERLWGTTLLARWPDRLVTEPFPHAAFAQAVGVAARFWHELALTCWFICEGPTSRTDLAGAPSYYDRELKALADLGHPIDRALFDDLRTAEKLLVPRPTRPDFEDEIAPGITLMIRMGPEPKDGFEHLRDVITRYRRAWATDHLHSYVRARWEHDLHRCGDAYHRHVADKGKPPTTKQFAKTAQDAANNWFGGNLTQLLDALGLLAVESPVYHRRMPADRATFIARLKERIGGIEWERQPKSFSDQERTVALRKSQMADRAAELVQLWEAADELPTLKGNSWFRPYLEEVYGDDLEAGWQWFISEVAAVVEDTNNGATANLGTTPVARPQEAQPGSRLADAATRPAVSVHEAGDGESERRGWRRLLGHR